jgi:hypothetical protein
MATSLKTYPQYSNLRHGVVQAQEDPCGYHVAALCSWPLPTAVACCAVVDLIIATLMVAGGMLTDSPKPHLRAAHLGLHAGSLVCELTMLAALMVAWWTAKENETKGLIIFASMVASVAAFLLNLIGARKLLAVAAATAEHSRNSVRRWSESTYTRGRVLMGRGSVSNSRNFGHLLNGAPWQVRSQCSR